jgi:hypothetical protein
MPSRGHYLEQVLLTIKGGLAVVNRATFDPSRWPVSMSLRLQLGSRPAEPRPQLEPMNGQSARLRFTREIIERCGIVRVVETGTYQGSTTAFFATFGLPVITAEINPKFAAFSRERLNAWKNVELYESDSVQVLKKLVQENDGRSVPTLFYLDAHWAEHLPLREEAELAVANFSKAVLMIDDFKIPDDPGYGFDDYGPGRRLDIDYLRAANLPNLVLYFPSTPLHLEDGYRRGCVVATADPEIAAILDRLVLLRRWIQL